ncbi:spore cortex biosynthesis protein YabQ [Peribacillus glennii]|uniref:Spore cortex biosynthesis protein YabQ n=1 Tax=Peribacillus glennii TaxID=2303991 RepID=A0A372LAE3_9BACI|nr:spore cortex biosynthesis protein YabQ [Peribacillus glennii]RFU62652.1 spore cortex biosynthesis protein YabQ [Peribacillus glennii]
MTLSVQFYTLLAMIGMGSYFGAALDTYNRFLKRSKRKSWIVFINDFLFWVVQGLIIFYVLFLVNEGELRLYSFIALFCGFSAYQALMKGLFLRCLEAVIKFILATGNFIAKSFQILIYHPIKWLAGGVIFLLIGLLKVIFFMFRQVLKVIYSVIKIMVKPFRWLFMATWNFLPKSVTKTVGKFYNGITGFFYKIKNLIKRYVAKWRNKPE